MVQDLKREPLLKNLERLLKKGPITVKRFQTVALGSEENSLHSSQISIVQKDPKINNKSSDIFSYISSHLNFFGTKYQKKHPKKESKKFLYTHYKKSKLHQNEAISEFTGSTLGEFLYPGEGRVPKVRLVIDEMGGIGVTSRCIDGTNGIDQAVNILGLKDKYEPNELSISPESLCKILALEDFIGLNDNHSNNRRKMANGDVIRIDFESINFNPELSIENHPSKCNSQIDEGIIYTEAYIAEIEKMAKLNQKDLDMILIKIENIIDMYHLNLAGNTGEKQKLTEIYKDRIQQMNQYAQELRNEQKNREDLKESKPLEYIKTRFKDLGMYDVNTSLRNSFRAAEWIAQQANEYKIPPSEIIQSCLSLEEKKPIEEFEFQVLFILAATYKKDKDITKLIDSARLETLKMVKKSYVPHRLFELFLEESEREAPPYGKDINSICCNCSTQAISDVFDQMGLFLKDMDIKDPSFVCNVGSVTGKYTPREPFEHFKDKCLLNFAHYVETVKKDPNYLNDTDEEKSSRMRR